MTAKSSGNCAGRNMKHIRLKRTISLPLLVLYGVGTMLGAGIYVLLGKVAGSAGIYLPIAFIGAAAIAAFTALAYAELSSRYPESAGEVIYVQNAFTTDWLSMATGWLVIATGTISAATLANGFTGYLDIFLVVPEWLTIVVLICALGSLAAWGITQSAWTAAAITVLEAGGLLLIIVIGGKNLNPAGIVAELPSIDLGATTGIIAGAHLAFYAFIGFEDMINVAEEVREPRRILPLSIILALAITTILYVLVCIVAVNTLSLSELKQSDAPLASIIMQHGYSPNLIALISLLAVVNGALVQIIMASRVLYGMGKHGLASEGFAKVSRVTRTPLLATLAITAIILVAALALPIETLAKLASSAAFGLFALINGALIVLKIRKPNFSAQFTVPAWVPAMGLLTCLSMLAFRVIG